MANPFSSAAMAEGYARSRPPLHERILKRSMELLGVSRAGTALDVGCGSGLSTAPLLGLADRVAGFDPAWEMLPWARRTAPGAAFFRGRAEALPVRTGSVDLVAAAGSLNYSDPEAALREAARVLRPGGAAVVYDFSQGRRSRSHPALAEWFAGFEARCPRPRGDGVELSPEILAALATGLRPAGAEYLEMALPMNRASYVAYLMTETNVAAAIVGGTPEREIRDWLWESLDPVFGEGEVAVDFAGYVACLRRE